MLGQEWFETVQILDVKLLEADDVGILTVEEGKKGIDAQIPVLECFASLTEAPDVVGDNLEGGIPGWLEVRSLGYPEIVTYKEKRRKDCHQGNHEGFGTAFQGPEQKEEIDDEKRNEKQPEKGEEPDPGGIGNKGKKGEQ